eukprot:10336189-Lingulodinium_polyedra.AAC.1
MSLVAASPADCRALGAYSPAADGRPLSCRRPRLRAVLSPSVFRASQGGLALLAPSLRAVARACGRSRALRRLVPRAVAPLGGFACLVAFG